jgi:hypothetical protein
LPAEEISKFLPRNGGGTEGGTQLRVSEIAGTIATNSLPKKEGGDV